MSSSTSLESIVFVIFSQEWIHKNKVLVSSKGRDNGNNTESQYGIGYSNPRIDDVNANTRSPSGAYENSGSQSKIYFVDDKTFRNYTLKLSVSQKRRE